MYYLIHMTNACNLNCSYCSNPDIYDYKRVDLLNKYTPKQISDFIKTSEQKLKSKECGVYFFGGEPTVVMDDVVTLAKELKKSVNNIELTLHTNGLLLDKVPFYLLKNLDNIFVSINSEMVNDNNKLSRYYLDILSKLDKIKKDYNGKIIARLTIIGDMSLYSEVMRSIGAFDLIYWQLENRATPQQDKNYSERYLFEFERLVNFWWKLVDSGVVIGALPFVTWAAQLFGLKAGFKGYPCDAGKDVFLGENGECFICPEMLSNNDVFCGNIEEGINLSKMNTLTIPKETCSSCEYFALCGGRCLRMHIEFSESRMQTYCDITKNSIKIFKNYAKKRSFETLPRQSQKQLKNLMRYTSLCEMVP